MSASPHLAAPPAALPGVLVIDDDAGLCTALTVALEDEFAVETANSGAEGLDRLQETLFPLVLLDIRMPGMTGLEVLRRIQTLDPSIAVVMHTVRQEVPVVVRAMQDGAVDFLTKPCDVDVLRTHLHQALHRAQHRRPAPLTLHAVPDLMVGQMVIGQHRSMRQLWDILHRVADTTATVLLMGESGTGKEALARSLHQVSPRRDGEIIGKKKK